MRFQTDKYVNFLETCCNELLAAQKIITVNTLIMEFGHIGWKMIDKNKTITNKLIQIMSQTRIKTIGISPIKLMPTAITQELNFWYRKPVAEYIYSNYYLKLWKYD